MATTKDYKDFILEQLNILDNITCKSMMGEYLLYYNGLLFGGIYDDRLLVKIVDNNKKYNMQESIPYESAKPMYLVDDVDNQEVLRDIVLDTCKDLRKYINDCLAIVILFPCIEPDLSIKNIKLPFISSLIGFEISFSIFGICFDGLKV